MQRPGNSIGACRRLREMHKLRFEIIIYTSLLATPPRALRIILAKHVRAHYIMRVYIYIYIYYNVRVHKFAQGVRHFRCRRWRLQLVAVFDPGASVTSVRPRTISGRNVPPLPGKSSFPGRRLRGFARATFGAGRIRPRPASMYLHVYNVNDHGQSQHVFFVLAFRLANNYSLRPRRVRFYTTGTSVAGTGWNHKPRVVWLRFKTVNTSTIRGWTWMGSDHSKVCFSVLWS